MAVLFVIGDHFDENISYMTLAALQISRWRAFLKFNLSGLAVRERMNFTDSAFHNIMAKTAFSTFQTRVLFVGEILIKSPGKEAVPFILRPTRPKRY